MVVRSPCQENDPADAHPSALKSVLESANPRMDSEVRGRGPYWGHYLEIEPWMPRGSRVSNMGEGEGGVRSIEPPKTGGMGVSRALQTGRGRSGKGLN